MLKNKYKRWLNLELFKAEGGPSKFEKIKQMAEILYSIRPEVGRFCWDDTIFRGKNDEPEVPEEIIASHAEVQEEMTQKVTRELDQMFIEDDESNEDVEYASIELVEVPDSDIVTENALDDILENDVQNATEKNKVQSKITSFFSTKK